VKNFSPVVQIKGMKTLNPKTPSFRILSGRPPKARIIDQRALPHRLVLKDLRRFQEVCRAIRDMEVRGAPLIGVTAAFGMVLAAQEAPGDIAPFHAWIKKAALELKASRPTAVNLAWAVDRQYEEILRGGTLQQIKDRLLESAKAIAAEDEQYGRQIGQHGLKVIRKIARRKKGKPVQIMTHCNAGRLAAVNWGTATAPMYAAHLEGIPVHVWVSETRPRNQGASLTAWELGEEGVPHTLVVDNACGHLLQQGLVDLVIVGCDRMAGNGDAANKIGTYLKALAAKANGIPFYVALPSSTIDWRLKRGVGKIPIEDRGVKEVLSISGLSLRNKTTEVRLSPKRAAAKNPGFDVTPAPLISGIITERGVCRPSALKGLFRPLSSADRR